jgi:E-phenylitaconyl-CoA hydratase
MTLCGRSYQMTAERAHELGLVDEVVPLDRLLETADEIAHQIAANSPAAVQLSMQAIWSSLDLGYTQAQEYGWSLVRMHWAHPDFKEGPRAFVEKRAPRWHEGSSPEPSSE